MNNSLYPDVLETNRKGRVAMSQVKAGLVGRMLLGAFMLFIGVGILLMALPDFSFTNIAAGILCLWLGYKPGGQILFDVVLGSVSQIEGKGEKYITTPGGKLTYRYSVGEQILNNPSREAHEKLNDTDNNVRAYYLTRSKTLINLEW